MGFDQPNQRPEDEKALIEDKESEVLKPIHFLPFDVQLQNTFCIEIMARRFPADLVTMPHVQVGLEEAQVDSQNRRAQVTLHIQTVSTNNPPPFDISFKILGLFTYSEDYHEEKVRLVLEQGSLSVLLPFARELLFSICARLQVPPMMLSMVQLAPHPSIHNPSHEEDLNNE